MDQLQTLSVLDSYWNYVIKQYHMTEYHAWPQDFFRQGLIRQAAKIEFSLIFGGAKIGDFCKLASPNGGKIPSLAEKFDISTIFTYFQDNIFPFSPFRWGPLAPTSPSLYSNSLRWSVEQKIISKALTRRLQFFYPIRSN